MESDALRDHSSRIRTMANELLAIVGLPAVDSFTLVGTRPQLDSPLPLADIASAFQLAVTHATALVANQSPKQTYEVCPAQALAGLEPTHFQRIHQHRFPQSSHGKELKSGFYETADGYWYLPSGSYPHLRDGTLAMLNCANTAQAIGASIQSRQANALEETAHREGVPGTWARTPDSWLSSDLGSVIAASPLISQQLLRTGPTDTVPLSSLKVLDLSHVIAGPVVARHFALCGADVLRLSSPSQPDPLPQIMDTGIGKNNAFADFHDPEDLAQTHRLASQADIIVNSWRPGALEKFGLGATQLLSHNRRHSIYVTVSAYGPDGPWASRKAFDQVVQASCGIAMLHADAKGRPHLCPTRLLTDYLTGQLGIIGVLGALYQRQHTGGSWHVHVSLARVATYLLGFVHESHRGTDIFDSLHPSMVTYQGPFGITHHVAPAVRCTTINHGIIKGPHLLGSAPASWREAHPINDTQTVRSLLSSSH